MTKAANVVAYHEPSQEGQGAQDEQPKPYFPCLVADHYFLRSEGFNKGLRPARQSENDSLVSTLTPRS